MLQLFVMIEDQPGAVKSWVWLLKKGGRLIFDVPTRHTQLMGLALKRIAEPLAVLRRYMREGIESQKKISLLFD